MTVRPITMIGHKALSRPTRKVREVTDDIRTLVADMIETNDAADGAGLAAPQVGARWRIFVYACPDTNGIERRGVVINPVLERIGPPVLDEETLEGCLSVPGEGFPTARSPCRPCPRDQPGRHPGRDRGTTAGCSHGASSTRSTTSTGSCTWTACPPPPGDGPWTRSRAAGGAPRVDCTGTPGNWTSPRCEAARRGGSGTTTSR
jgi:hypothetical protein